MVSQEFLNFSITWGILGMLALIFYSGFRKQTVVDTLKDIKEAIQELKQDE